MTKKEKFIKTMQDNLKLLRKAAEWSMEELGEEVGLTKQSISNLEKKSCRMAFHQAIAFKLIFDKKSHTNVLLKYILAIIESSDYEDNKDIFELISSMDLSQKNIQQYVMDNVLLQHIFKLQQEKKLPCEFYETVKNSEVFVPEWLK